MREPTSEQCTNRETIETEDGPALAPPALSVPRCGVLEESLAGDPGANQPRALEASMRKEPPAPEKPRCKCGQSMALRVAWDDAQETDHCFNVWSCSNCGRILKQDQWNDSGEIWIGLEGIEETTGERGDVIERLTGEVAGAERRVSRREGLLRSANAEIGTRSNQQFEDATAAKAESDGLRRELAQANARIASWQETNKRTAQDLLWEASRGGHDVRREVASRKDGALKRYLTHITLLRDDSPHDADDFDIMDWTDEKHELLAKYTRDFSPMHFVCPVGGRDKGMDELTARILADNPGYSVMRASTPGYDGWVGDGE